jgi:hypothetical protein
MVQRYAHRAPEHLSPQAETWNYFNPAADYKTIGGDLDFDRFNPGVRINCQFVWGSEGS